MKNKRLILPIIIIFILIIIIGTTYAVYTYTNTSSNKELLAGNIYLNYTGSTGINIQDAMPGSDYSDYYEFTINGSNDYSKDIYYDVILLKGDLPTGKTENNRIKDEYLKFKLVEVNDSVETTLLTDISYSDISNKKLYVSTVPANTINYSKTYRLYMTISEDLTIGTNSDYSIEEWSNAFASVKVKVTGDFTERETNESVNISTQNLINLAVSYSTASATNFTGGLVAINNDGTLYNENSSSEEIREYRYTGLSVNNYVFFDTDGDGVQDDNEIWRIVGIFKNESDEWNLKLMRNTLLTSSELPETYTYNGTNFDLKYEYNGNTYAYFNSTIIGTYYNDWTTAGLQYFLNASDGYFGTLLSSVQGKVASNYTYYLGNTTNWRDLHNNSDSETTIQSYTSERNSSNIFSGNKATWTGAVALLYPSDYGYSANSSYWSGTTLLSYSSAAATSWMQQNADHNISELFLSPSSYDKDDTDYVARWDSYGYVIDGRTRIDCGAVRPVLNLKADAVIDINHTGSETDPYICS